MRLRMAVATPPPWSAGCLIKKLAARLPMRPNLTHQHVSVAIMTTSPSVIEEADVLLAEAARMDMVFARHIQQCALDVAAPEALDALSRAYARVTRSMRQNLALLARQKSDREKADRERKQHAVWLEARSVAPADFDLHALAVEERTRAVQDAVDRVISAASDGEARRHSDYAHRLDRELDDWTEDEDFLLGDLDNMVARACRVLDLPDDLARRWRDLPKPTFAPTPQTVAGPQPAEPAAPSAGAADLSPDGAAAQPTTWRSSA